MIFDNAKVAFKGGFGVLFTGDCSPLNEVINRELASRPKHFALFDNGFYRKI